jgi:hypothetical protein
MRPAFGRVGTIFAIALATTYLTAKIVTTATIYSIRMFGKPFSFIYLYQVAF